MARYEAAIFVTGAIVLALEVLASRIMTPYFGVSLYIWSGILSITLTFLAAGYYAGGWLSRRLDPVGLECAFLAAPAVSALSIAISAAVYPALFPKLTDLGLVAGSFIGGGVLLTLPLVTLSSMNPVLVALERSRDDAGDAGAGRVFFVSTIGSVAGVLLTAFVFIPRLTNFRSILLLGLGLCALVVAMTAASASLERARKLWLTVGSGAAAALCLGLLLGQRSYLDWVSGETPFEYTIEAEYTSVFGNIKVVRLRYPQPGAAPLLSFFQDGLVQNLSFEDGTSNSTYTYVLEKLAHAFAPRAKRAAVLGLAAGVVPRGLVRRGIDVTAIEINSDAVEAAERFFAFDPASVDLRIEDARTFVRGCRDDFDIVVVDLFNGDGTPDYLMTGEFFQDVARCLRAGGVTVVNAIYDTQDDAPNQAVRATLLASFAHLLELRSPTNEAAFLAATNGEPPARVFLDPSGVPPSLHPEFSGIARSWRWIGREQLADVPPITDEHNLFRVLFEGSERRFRRQLTQGLPARLLVN